MKYFRGRATRTDTIMLGITLAFVFTIVAVMEHMFDQLPDDPKTLEAASNEVVTICGLCHTSEYWTWLGVVLLVVNVALIAGLSRQM